MLEAARKNPLIAASIALPLLLVVVFALAGLVPRMLVADPAYDLVLSQYDPAARDGYEVSIDIVVDNSRAVARVMDRGEAVMRGRPRVYVFDHRTGSIREATIDWPDNAEDLEAGAVLPIPDLAGNRISTAQRAPDGWEYRGVDHHDGLLFGFFGSRRADRISIGKDGAIEAIDLPDPPYYGYNSVRFVGWIVE